MKNWTAFKLQYNIEVNKQVSKVTESVLEDGKKKISKKNMQLFYMFTKNISKHEKSNIERLGKIIDHNFWCKYFIECGAEIDGWIDFEREIIPVLNLISYVLNGNIINGDTPEKYQMACILPKYFHASGSVHIQEEYKKELLGIKKKTLLNDLKNDLNEFIEAMELYMIEFADYKKEKVKQLKQLEEIKPDYVISFNYTQTEKLYGIEDENVHHIHGEIKSQPNNMVLGVNEDLRDITYNKEQKNLDFVYFVKYFQRIQKHSGVKYKSFVNKVEDQGFGEAAVLYDLHIYGHSLDATDEDILKYVIGDISGQGELIRKAQKVYIYHYVGYDGDNTDYERKIINLIDLYGRKIVEEALEIGYFNFILCDNLLVNG